MSDKSASVSGTSVRFARSATKHRVSKDSIRHVIAHYRVQFEEPPSVRSPASRSTRIVYLGDDEHGQALEVVAVAGDRGEQLVIHAMPLREKYRKHYREPRR
jgi:hypothetical protein